MERILHLGMTKAEWNQLTFESEAERYVKQASRSFAEDTLIDPSITFERAKHICDDLGLDWGAIVDWRFYMKLNSHLLPHKTDTSGEQISLSQLV
ncbi:MAG: hypothetical protein Q7T50_04345 [Candidatus Magasanikbacteria bacterium]|nr:hypothetical protein [Candidatus Magasanikbacteria bacterium]